MLPTRLKWIVESTVGSGGIHNTLCFVFRVPSDKFAVDSAAGLINVCVLVLKFHSDI